MHKIIQWWLDINIKTRLISVIILFVSLLISSFIFIILITIHHKAVDIESHFCKDLSLLLSEGIIDLLNEKNFNLLEVFAEKVYLTTSSIRYIQLLDNQGNIFLSFPAYDKIIHNVAKIPLSILSKKFFLFNIPIVNSWTNSSEGVINITIPLFKSSKNAGILSVGCNLNPSLVSMSQAIQGLSITVFVSIWLIFILGANFNFIIFNETNQKLVQGLKNIAEGNFNYRVKVSSGKWEDLLTSFNLMSERLQLYEQKNVEQLIYEKVKLETLVSTLADGVILLDTDLRLLFVNQIASKVLHWENNSFIGDTINQHLPLYLNDVLFPVLNSMVKINCLDNESVQTQEMSVNLDYDSFKTFRFLLTTVLDQEDSELFGIVLTIQDITQETQLNDAKNHFISNVSHELRTPLCNIGSFLETLMDYNHRLSSKQKDQFLSIAYTETKRLNRLVNDILDLSRLDAEYSYSLSEVKFMNTINYLTELYRIIALNKEIQVIWEISCLVDTIVVHESSFCQILSNLISNSLKFTHVDGKIVVRVYPLVLFCPEIGKYNIVRIEVIDEGIGIEKMFLKQIFDRFMRIENYIHTLQGTGLGLSIVKSIIEKHQSEILVYSEVGVGTSFWFDLPISCIN